MSNYDEMSVEDLLTDQFEEIDDDFQDNIEKPKMYFVVILNDDYTPMGFVTDLIERFFGFGTAQAMIIMLDVHENGKGYCGSFPKDIAETKAKIVNEYSRQHQHPLRTVVEPV